MMQLNLLNWERLAPYTSKATLELARYDGTLNGIVNPAVLLSPITDREAVLSSQIEGTHATMVEVLQHEAGQDYDEAKRGEIREIINYRRALLTAEDYLKERPVTLQLIRELHAILMKDVRGNDKTPGKFRDDQNWIGKKGSTIEQARFVPPDPLTMHDYLEKLQALPTSRAAYHSYLKKSLSQKGDPNEIIRGISLSEKFWKAFIGSMENHYHKYMWVDDLLNSCGVKCDEDSVWTVNFCKGIFISEDKEEALINAFDRNESIQAIQEQPTIPAPQSSIAIIEPRLLKLDKKTKWIFWIALLTLLFMLGKFA